MSATYEPTLPTSRDKVRFLVGDTDVDPGPAQLQDEEIDWILTEQSNVHFAAARALSVLLMRWGNAGEGVLEKRVEDLELRWGVDDTARDVLQRRIEELRVLGSPQPRRLRVVGDL